MNFCNDVKTLTKLRQTLFLFLGCIKVWSGSQVNFGGGDLSCNIFKHYTLVKRVKRSKVSRKGMLFSGVIVRFMYSFLTVKYKSPQESMPVFYLKWATEIPVRSFEMVFISDGFSLREIVWHVLSVRWIQLYVSQCVCVQYPLKPR